jgi:hypothetical protein
VDHQVQVFKLHACADEVCDQDLTVSGGETVGLRWQSRWLRAGCDEQGA